MILGIGIDMCQVERIRRSLKRFGDAWVEPLYSPAEQRLCRAAADPILLFARGFCGKEACAKALGTGFANGVNWRDIEVLHAPFGLATMRLSGGARDFLAALIPKAQHAAVHITCSGTRRLVQATVIVSVIPNCG